MINQNDRLSDLSSFYFLLANIIFKFYVHDETGENKTDLVFQSLKKVEFKPNELHIIYFNLS